MADAILSELVNIALEKLITYAEQEILMLSNVKNELCKLNDTRSRIQAVLRDADQQQTLNYQDQDFLEKLNKVKSDIEDLLDDFKTETRKRELMCGNKAMKEVCLFFSSSNQLVYGHNLGKKLHNMRFKLVEIVEEKKNFSLTVDPPNKIMEPSISLLPEVVIGRKADKQAIIDRLLGSNNEETVIPILGLGGMGKTTLAQLVFNDNEVSNHFELKLWVSIPSSFDLKLILQKILESIIKTEPGNLDPNNLSELICDKLRKKKYLLVLDDVWNEDQDTWDNLERILKSGEKGCKIILTTRLEKVSRFPHTKIHRLRGLSNFESWELLQKFAFYTGNVPEDSGNLVKVGEDIASNCLGVPLVIRTVGRVLYGKTIDEWMSFKENELSTIAQNEESVLNRLKLSYNHLPLPLKSCFSYCSLFPKGYEINVEMLVQLWMAQGLISFSGKRKPYEELEDVGRKNFKELWWRSFFLEVKKNAIGNLISCRMHDLMHDLAASVASRETLILKSNGDDVHQNTYHVSFDFNVNVSWQISSNLCRAKKLRTFLLPKQNLEANDEGMSGLNLEAICSNFKRLHVLDLHDLGINQLSPCIKKLKYLKYLDASGNDRIEFLPVSITKLQNLVVLKLFGCTRLKELPKDITKLIDLRCLDCRNCWNLSHMPQGLGKLTSLQTLLWFVVAEDNIDSKHVGGLGEFGNLNKLRTIEIRHLRFVKDAKLATLAKLQDKHHLCSLTLSWNIEVEDINVYSDYIRRSSNYTRHDNVGAQNDVEIDQQILENLKPNKSLKQLRVYEFGGMNFPSWLPSITNVVELWIVSCKRLQHLPPLDQLASLRDLWLSELTNLIFIDERECTFSNVSFPSLKLLKIWSCPNLKRWWKNDNEDNDLDGKTTTSVVELPQFQCLSTLDIRGCQNLKWMPEFSYSYGTLWFQEVNLSRLQRVSPSGKVGFLNCLTSFSNVVKIGVSNCKGCCYFPPLDDLPSLAEIYFDKVDDLEYIGREAMNGKSRFFPSLKNLSIKFCPKFKGWWKARNDDEEVGDVNATEMLHFPCLSWLAIEHCPQLIHLPFFPTLDSTLWLLNTSCTKAFEQTVDMHISSGKRSSSGDSRTAGLTNLWRLELSKLEDLEYIGIEDSTSLRVVVIDKCKSLKRWWKNEDNENANAKSRKFPALSKLDISCCPNLSFCAKNNAMQTLNPEALPITNLRELWLTDLPQLEFICVKAMPYLKVLIICNCPNLKGLGEEWKEDVCKVPVVTETEVPRFPCLSVLSIDGCHKLSSMPLFPFIDGKLSISGSIEALENLVNVTSSSLPLHPLWKLKKLVVGDTKDIQSLPSIQHLKSLQSLEILDCPKLKALPEGVDNLTCLKKLRVEGCPMVSERCEKHKGVDWPHIAHIPDIGIDSQEIQREVERSINRDLRTGELRTGKSLSDVTCEECGSGDFQGLLLLCDKCDKACHTFCLRPIINSIPEGSWYCSSCFSQKKPNV